MQRIVYTAVASAVCSLALACAPWAAPQAWLDQPITMEDGSTFTKELFDDLDGPAGYLTISGVVTDVNFL